MSNNLKPRSRMHRLSRLLEQDTRRVVGLMSGTSLDGIDVALAQLSGNGRALAYELLFFLDLPYPERLRELLIENSVPETSSVRALSQLNMRLAQVYADAVRQATREAGYTLEDLDLIGSHGQTVQHVPHPEDCAGEPTRSSLQIGDPSALANLLGVPVVGDFRPADIALGGQGAPLVPYFDYAAFADGEETRGLLNLGGIANLTVLPADASPGDVYAFDTGPADMVIDELAWQLFGRLYDEDGAWAAEGAVHEDLLETLLQDEYFSQPPPKSTGREWFGTPYVDRLLERADGISPHDLMATATALTARSIHRAYEDFIQDRHALDVMIASGGGTRNHTLMRMLRESFAPVPVRTSDAYGIDPDAKEALCFAVLAHETLSSQPTGLPPVTGAERPTLLGKICIPTSKQHEIS